MDILDSAVEKLNGKHCCPNCGAAVEAEKCPYCGTVFIDFATVDMDKPFYIKFKHANQILVSKVRMERFTIEVDNDGTFLYADGLVVEHIPHQTTHFELNLGSVD